MLSIMAGQPTSSASTPGALLRAARAASKRPAVRALLLAGGLSLFVALAVGSFRSLPPIDSPAWWAAAILVLATTPLTLALNTAEFRLIASTAGSSFRWEAALSTTVVASLANLLPLPGAAAVRMTALVRRGASLRVAGEANVLAAALWLGVTADLAAVGLLASGSVDPWIAVLVLGIGCATTGGALWRVRSLAGARTATRLLLIEVSTVLVSAVRVWLGYQVVRQTIGAGEAVAISSGTVLSALVGFVPGGLGVRELLAGGLAAMIGQRSTDAIAATVVDRLAAQIGMVLVWSVLMISPSGLGRSALEDFRGREPK